VYSHNRTAWAGKWHLPDNKEVGFERLSDPLGRKRAPNVWPGANRDPQTSAASAEFLSRQQKDPFLLVASFINPHDICDWIHANRRGRSSYPELST